MAFVWPLVFTRLAQKGGEGRGMDLCVNWKVEFRPPRLICFKTHGISLEMNHSIDIIVSLLDNL